MRILRQANLANPLATQIASPYGNSFITTPLHLKMNSFKTRRLTVTDSFPSLSRKNTERNNSLRSSNLSTLPEGKNPLIYEMEKKIAEQRLELEERNTRVESIVEKVNDFMDSLVKEKEVSENYKAKCERLIEKIEQVKLLNGKLNGEIAVLRKREEKNQREIEELALKYNGDCEELGRELAKKGNSAKSLEVNNSLLKGQCFELEKRVKDLEANYIHEGRRLTTLTNESNELLEKKDREIGLLANEKAHMEREIRVLKESISNERAIRTKTENELRETNDEKYSNEEELNRIIDGLRNEKSMLNHRKDRINTEDQALRAEIRYSRDQLAEKDNEIGEMTNRLERTNIKYKEVLEEQHRQRSEMNALSNRIHLLNLENAKLQDQLSEMIPKDDYSALTEENMMLRSQLALLSSKESKLTEAEIELESLKAANAALAVEYDTLVSQSKLSEEQLQSLHLKLSRLTEEKEKNREFYYSKLHEIKQLKRQVTQKDQIISSIPTDETPKYQSEITSLTTQLNDAALYTNSVETNISLLKQTIDEQSTTIDILNSQITLINESDLKQQHEALQLKESEIQQTLTKLETAVSSLEIELSCTRCFSIMEHCKTFIPCGHSFCAECATGSNSACYECNSSVTFMIISKTIENLCSKLNYQKLVITSLLKL